VPWAIAVVAVSVAALVWFSRGVEPTPPPLARLELTLPANIELYNSARTIALSPDGSRLAFIGVLGGARLIYLRRLDQFEAIALRGTDNASTMFFSDEGTSIGFITGPGALKTISLGDGVVTTITDAASFIGGGAWSPDGTLIFPRGSTLWRVGAAGGDLKQLTKLDAGRGETRHAWPIVLPGGKTMLFAVAAAGEWHIESFDLQAGQRRPLISSGTLPLYVDGHLAYVRDGQIFSVPFNAAALETTGPAVLLIDGIPVLSAEVPLVDISRSGTVVYSATTAFSTLVSVARNGEEQVLNGERRTYTNPRTSPDGQRLIVQAGDLWLQDLSRGTFSRLTNGSILPNGFPIWLPDGRVMYRSSTGLTIQGTGGPEDAPQVVSGTNELDYPGAVAPDNDTLVFLRSTEATSFNILTLSLRQPANAKPLRQSPAYESGARLSPDGRWMTWVSNETGRNEVYLSAFPGPAERVPVSTDGGTQAIWNPNGKEIFYRLDDKMIAVDVTTSPALKLSAPKVLFESRYAFGAGVTIPNFDVSRDGQRFIMVKAESGAGRLNVVLNWFGQHGIMRD